MSSDDALFGDPNETDVAPPTPPRDEQLPDWQVTQLRGALDAQGVTDMAARQQLVESIVERPVASLRDLTFAEARRLVDTLAESRRRAEPEDGRSSWDTREEDTWIDRL